MCPALATSMAVMSGATCGARCGGQLPVALQVAIRGAVQRQRAPVEARRAGRLASAMGLRQHSPIHFPHIGGTIPRPSERARSPTTAGRRRVFGECKLSKLRVSEGSVLMAWGAETTNRSSKGVAKSGQVWTKFDQRCSYLPISITNSGQCLAGFGSQSVSSTQNTPQGVLFGEFRSMFRASVQRPAWRRVVF